MMMENGLSMEDYSENYMEQEEEWEREGLLDPAWEKQQKKVRTRNPTQHKLINPQTPNITPSSIS